jgi:hypothetical protein
MPHEESPLLLSAHLVNPLCSRHPHVMTYEKDGISWKEEMDAEAQTLASYHCHYQSCTVHYSLGEGYFTVADAPGTPRFIGEPGVNLYTCPRHGTWLYQSKDEEDREKLTWRCGVDNCRHFQPGRARPGAVDHPNV